MTVVIITIRLEPGVDASEFVSDYADLIRETGRDTGEVRDVTYEIRETRTPRELWCPVCGIFHREPLGEKTDAGVTTRACPRVSTDDPRYYGSPVYTGDR